VIALATVVERRARFVSGRALARTFTLVALFAFAGHD